MHGRPGEQSVHVGKGVRKFQRWCLLGKRNEVGRYIGMAEHTEKRLRFLTKCLWLNLWWVFKILHTYQVTTDIGKDADKGTKVQIFHYQINKFSGCNVQHGAIVNNTILYIWKLLRVDLKSSHYRKKKIQLWEVTNVN